MKKPSKIESIQDETMFAALSAEESLEVVGGLEAAASGCKLTISCTFSGSGDTATVSDQISF